VTKVIIVSGTSHPLPTYWSAKPTPEHADPLYGVKIKIRRADEHVANIESIVEAFGGSHRIVREMEPDGVYETVKLLVAPVPEMLPVIVGEVVFHLRSALDNLACCLAIANGKSAKKVCFPIAGDRQKFELPDTQGKIQNLSPTAQKLIRRLKPYKGGNNLLWVMNRLRNDDVHTRLLPLVLDGPHWKSPTITTLIPSGAMIEIEYPQAFEDQIVLARCLHGAKIEYDAEPVIGIAFDDIEFLKGESIVACLRQMVNLTARVVQIFERHLSLP